MLEKGRRLTAFAGALVMFAAMMDMSAGHLLMAPPTWAAVLTITAMATTTTQMALQPIQRTMALHRGAGAVIVAVLLLTTQPMATMPNAADGHTMASMTGSETMTNPAPGDLSTVMCVGATALSYVLASIMIAVRHARAGRIPAPSARRGPSLQRERFASLLDVAAMAACVLLMTVTTMP